MHIEKIRIQNFRQLKDAKLELQNNTTILAGPNNSGKTSVILLLKRILLEKNFSYQKDDINAYDKYVWSEKIYEVLKSIYDNKEGKSSEELMEEFTNKVFSEENIATGNTNLTLPALVVKMQIDYNDTDDITNFANYIMDLDCSHNSVYLICKSLLNKDLFIKEFGESWSKVFGRLNGNGDSSRKQTIIDIIISIYCNNMDTKYYFTDETYEVQIEIPTPQEFKSLFNFKYIEAARPLNDSLEKDKHSLSDTLVTLASKDSKWKDEISKLPDKVLGTLDEAGIKATVEQVSATALNGAIESITKTNAGHTEKISLNLEVSEEHIKSLIKNTTNARYSIEGKIINTNYNLNETSQGLGYSNLVYMHTQIEEYIKSKDELKVNFLVIEEPESHMHPQMQYVFANKLLEQYDQEKLQGLITTHSSEIVRGTGIERLRVIRQETLFNAKIYNLSSFINDIPIPQHTDDSDIAMIKDYKSFYEDIGISEIIFADIAILFEGDTERLYLKKIINLPQYEELQKKYVAFIQVGGAYAFRFQPILEFLKIKTLIITDIDYEEGASNEEQILEATTTNATIKKFYEITKFNDKEPKPEEFRLQVSELYDWIINNKHIVVNTNRRALDNSEDKEELIYLAFQTDKDSYTRTLEAAMLSKLFGITGYELIKRNEWIKRRDDTGLKYSVPNKKKDKQTGEVEQESEFSLIDILNSTAKSKTDFMYSVILNGHAEAMLPEYIKEGLKWLM